MSTMAARSRIPASVALMSPKVSAIKVDLQTLLITVELHDIGWIVASVMLRIPGGAKQQT